MPHFSRILCAAAICLSLAVLDAAERPRLAVLTDIGADPDDQQSMIRLMVYANEFDLELLIATGAGAPGELKEAITRPELIRQILDAYGEVLPNLQRHAAGWPTVESLRARVIRATLIAAASTSAPATTRRRRGRSSTASTRARRIDP